MMQLRYVWPACVLAMTACSAGSTSPAVPPAVAQSHSVPDRTNAKTLYVTNFANPSELLGYSVSTLQQIYSTTNALNEPQGIAVDKSGAVWVANTYGYNLLKFKPPATTPIQTIDDRKFRPTDVAIDSEGNIWVANWCSRKLCKPGNVHEYDSAGKLLQTIKCPNLTFHTYLAIDRKGDVVVDGDGTSYSDAGEIKAGSATCTPLPSIHAPAPGGVAFLKDGDLTVIDQLDNVMRTYAKPSFSKLVATTSFYGVQYLSDAAFESGDDYFFATCEGGDAVFEFAYPGGGAPLRRIDLYFPSGVAIGPTLSGR